MIRHSARLLLAVLASTAAVEPATAQQSAPPPLHEEGVALDVGRGRLVLFGGTRAEGESYVNVGDTWEWDGSGWRLAVPAGDGPGARTVATMAYDPGRRSVTMYGGASGDWETGEIQLLRDVWTYDGTRWVRGPDGPESWNARLVYDSRRGEMLLAGIAGPWVDGDGPFRVSLWRRLGDGWVFADSSGPRISSTLRPAFDARRGVLVLPVMEGPDAGVWEWDGGRWRHVQVTDGPRPRGRFIVAYDERAGGVMLFGGVAGPPPESFDDLWRWDGTRWTAVPATGAAAPAPRSDGTLVYDPASRRLLLVGGIANDDTMFREVWTLDASGWRKVH
ncbi:MAG TPA: hypothetical protein VHG08_07155 [Longimicrobium sp.]|nr:hypothetical protein [Longimicrobium sp.]